MLWCPDTAKVKKKMLYSSSFDALKKSLVGVQKYIQATDASEAAMDAVEEKLRATDRNWREIKIVSFVHLLSTYCSFYIVFSLAKSNLVLMKMTGMLILKILIKNLEKWVSPVMQSWLVMSEHYYYY